MSSVSRRKLLIIWFDLLIALSAFWLARYFGDMPRWYWLVLSAVIWAVLGGVSRKLQFGAYKRIRYAFLGIFTLDILSGLFLYTLYRHCVPGYEYDYSIILATGIIMVLEWALYCAVRRLVYRKIPFFYEEPLLDDVTEVGINTGIEHTELLENRDVTLLLNLTRKAENSMELLRRIQESLERFSPATTVMDSPEPESVLAHKVRLPRLVIHRCPLNRVRHINTLFSYTNYCMERGGADSLPLYHGGYPPREDNAAESGDNQSYPLLFGLLLAQDNPQAFFYQRFLFRAYERAKPCAYACRDFGEAVPCRV